MPPRGIVLVIVVFWLAMTALLVQREIVPRWRSGDAPAFAIELTDEVGSSQVEWGVFHEDRKIGRGLSHIRRQPDRSFEMSQEFRFDDFSLPVFVAQVTVKRLSSVYRVTREGQLLGLKLSGAATIKEPGGLALELAGDFSGDVKDGYLEPTFKATAFGQPVDLPAFGKFELAEHGSILNPMHLLHRLPNLREGQTWKVPMLDPLKMFSIKEILGQRIPALSSGVPYLDADVSADVMKWNGEEVPCLRVTYREPGKDEVARTWVRRDDGLVLAQEARQHGYAFIIRRVP